MGINFNEMKIGAIYRVNDGIYISRNHDTTGLIGKTVLYVYQVDQDRKIISYKMGGVVSPEEAKENESVEQEDKIFISGWNYDSDSSKDELNRPKQIYGIIVKCFEEVDPVESYLLGIEMVGFLVDKKGYLERASEKRMHKVIPGEVD